MKYAQVENREIYEEWTNSVGTGLEASRWPHQIRTFPDVAVRRQHVENKYSRMEGTHVAAGIEYPLQFLGKHVIKTNPSKFDERLFSEICLWGLRLKQGLQDYKKYRILYFEAGGSRGMLQQRIC